MQTDKNLPGPMERFALRGRRVLITGASRGIGHEFAHALSECGANVFCVARSAEKLDQLVADISGRGGAAACRAADLSNEDEVRSTVAKAAEHMGGIDILINNAGNDFEAPIEETSTEQWSDVLDLNLTACFLMCREAAGALKADGGGKVINVASLYGLISGPDNVAYISSKTGMIGLTRGLAVEWAQQGVQVNALCPGFITTEMTEPYRADESTNRAILERTPAGRWGEPQDLVGAAIFLASSASDFMTGISLAIDGGITAS
ncbi:MAG: glucose 1-dehydrogenase [Actinobacteria bacterium]|nr:glucose 1-dehydrogenase [Actinomycetota bacterium]